MLELQLLPGYLYLALYLFSIWWRYQCDKYCARSYWKSQLANHTVKIHDKNNLNVVLLVRRQVRFSPFEDILINYIREQCVHFAKNKLIKKVCEHWKGQHFDQSKL